MKTIKLDRVLFCLILLLASIAVQAQQEITEDIRKENNKIIIIKKIVDENGDVHTEKIIHEASELGLDLGMDLDKEDIQIEIIGSPEEMDKTMENMDVDEIETINVFKTGDEKQIRIKLKKGVTDPEIIEWDGSGEVPADIQQKMKDKAVFFHQSDQPQVSNKACLGVMIGKSITNENGVETIEGESEVGVTVLDIIEGSAAEAAGLLKDDILAAIAGTSVQTLDDVLNALQPFEAGATVTIDYLRDNQPAQLSATLKQCKSMTTNHIEIDEEIIDNDGHKRIIIINSNTEEIEEERVEGEEEEEIEEDFEWQELEENVNNTLEIQTIDLFPNPTDGKISVQFEAPASATTVRVVDLNGKEVYQEYLPNFDGTFQRQLDLSSAAQGALILTITQGEKIFTEKIILQ